MKKLLALGTAALFLSFGCSGPSQKCGSGTENADGTCVAVDGGPGTQCGAGTVLVGGACVALDAGPGTQCGNGTVLVNGQCLAVDAGPGTQCGSGTVLVGGECVALDAGPGTQCGDGTVLSNGECLAVDAGPSATVAVEIVGLGHGTVTGPGLTCNGSLCSVTALEGTQVALTATPDVGYFFAGWRGVDCARTGPCNVTVSGFKVLKAGFSAVLYWGGSDGTINAARSATTYEALGVATAAVEPRYTFAMTPDGMTVAFNDWRSDFSDGLWIIDYWNNTAQPVIGVDGWGVTYGGLSPDGSKIAYLDWSGSSYNVAVVNADGSGSTLVTNTQTYGDLLTDDCNNAWCATTRMVVWSPDGSHLAWIDRLPIESDGTDTVYYNVWVAEADGSNATRLTNFNSSTVSSDPGVTGADWSPDGSKIAFVSALEPGENRTGTNAITVDNIWTVDVDSKALFAATNFATQYRLDMATYARSGNKIIFSSVQDPALGTDAVDGRNLFSVSADGTGLAALTSSTVSGAFHGGPYWAPDGTTLLFESNIDPTDSSSTAKTHIWAVTPGAEPVAVTSSPDYWDYSPLDNND